MKSFRKNSAALMLLLIFSNALANDEGQCVLRNDPLQEIITSVDPSSSAIEFFSCNIYFSGSYVSASDFNPNNSQGPLLSNTNNNLNPCDCLIEQKYKFDKEMLNQLDRDLNVNKEIMQKKAQKYGAEIAQGVALLKEVRTSQDEVLQSELNKAENQEQVMQCLGIVEQSQKCKSKDYETEVYIEAHKGMINSSLNNEEEKHHLKLRTEMEKAKEQEVEYGGGFVLALHEARFWDKEEDDEVNYKTLFEKLSGKSRLISSYVEEKHPYKNRQEVIEATEKIIAYEKDPIDKRGKGAISKEDYKKAKSLLFENLASTNTWIGSAKSIRAADMNKDSLIKDFIAKYINQSNSTEQKNKDASSVLQEIEKQNIARVLAACSIAQKNLSKLCEDEPKDMSLDDVAGFFSDTDTFTVGNELKMIKYNRDIAKKLINKDEEKSRALHFIACVRNNAGDFQNAYKESNPTTANEILTAVNTALGNPEGNFIQPVQFITPAEQKFRQDCAAMLGSKGNILTTSLLADAIGTPSNEDKCNELYKSNIGETKVTETEKKAVTEKSIDTVTEEAYEVAKKEEFKRTPKAFKSQELKSYYEKIDRGDYVSARNSIKGLNTNYQLKPSDYKAPLNSPLISSNAVAKMPVANIVNYKSSQLDFSNSSTYDPKKFVVQNKADLAAVSPENAQKLEEVVEEREEIVQEIAKAEENLVKAKEANPEDSQKLQELEKRLNDLSTSLDGRDKEIAKLIDENRKLADELNRANASKVVAANPSSTAQTNTSPFAFKPRSNAPAQINNTYISEAASSSERVKDEEEKRRAEKQNLALSQSASGPTSIVFRGPSSLAQVNIPADVKSAEFQEFAEEAFRVGYEYEVNKVFIYDDEGQLKVLAKVGDEYVLRDVKNADTPMGPIRVMDGQILSDRTINSIEGSENSGGPVRYPDIPDVLKDYFPGQFK